MKRLAGQAGRTIGYLIHHTGMVIMTVFFVFALAVGGFAYRLSTGPVQIPWVTSRLATIVSGQGIDIRIGQAALAWGGYKSGGAVPLYLQLGDINVFNAAGVKLAAIPAGTLVFLPGALFGAQAPVLVTSTDALFAGSNVPVSLRAAIRLKGLGKLASARLQVSLGAGDLGAEGVTLPILGGNFAAAMTPHDVALTNGALRLAPSGASAPKMSFSGSAHLGQVWRGTLTIGADMLHADDLAAYWPPKLASDTRAWVVYNIRKGIATDASFTLGLGAPASLASLTLDAATGSFHASGLNVGWIPGAQPITGVAGVFTLTDRDTIDIGADTGSLGGIALKAAHMRMTGISVNKTIAALRVPVSGTLQDALAVLNAKPLNLLKSTPPQILGATGALNGTVIAGFPMLNNLQLAETMLNISGTLDDAAVASPIADLGFTKGVMTFQATAAALNLAGSAQFAGQPAQVAADLRFGPGNPAVTFTMQTVAGNIFLRQFGLNADSEGDDAVVGSVPIHVVLNIPSSGQGQATLNADLTKAAVSVPALGWSKKAGAAGRLELAGTLDGQALGAVTSLSASAPGLDVAAAADPAVARRLDITRLNIDGTSAQGSLTAPAGPKMPWLLDLSGPSLDVTAILNPPPGGQAKPPASKPAAPKPAHHAGPSGPLWAAKLRFASFRLAAHQAPMLRNLVFSGHGQGVTMFAGTASANGAGGQAFHLGVMPRGPAGDGEEVHLDSDDGGYLLRALGAFGDLDGGALVLDAAVDQAGNSAGQLTLEKFRLTQAPEFTKILQGLTIYGAPAAASGPGLAFERLVAPFGISGQTLTLTGARAFSSSLGFTASGTINLASGETDLDTTIVPAYALNAALGRIPVVGKLFSAEKGGGLFAVRAKITGPLMAPQASVNPLSAFTPGVLRDVFGLGGSPGA